MRSSATAMKSVKVFIFVIMRPPSCHGFPSSPPPRTWAVATMKPRSSRLTSLEEKYDVVGVPV